VAVRDIALGRFVLVDSPVHDLDPRTKIISTIALTIALFSSDSALVLAICGAVTLLAAARSHIPARLLLRSLGPFLWLFSFTFLLHAVLTPGQALWYLPAFDISFTREGIAYGLLLCSRLVIAISLASLMTLTTTPMELTNALERLLRPLRRCGFPAHEFAMMVTISIRFIPVLLDEAERLHKAQLSRGADFGGSLLQRARQMVPLIVPLFVSAFDRADRLALAMESRAYGCGIARTSFRELCFRRRDLVAAATTGISVIAIIMFDAL
jgi:energy-coupling factor transport system permease protein